MLYLSPRASLLFPRFVPHALPLSLCISLSNILIHLLTQETATLESETFVQQQKVAVAAEVKNVLDSWVRYEQQQKKNEQAELTKAVIDKVLATLKDEKTQKDIILAAITEVERECFSPMQVMGKFAHAVHDI